MDKRVCCPNCGSENVLFTLEKVTKKGLLPGLLLLTLGTSLMFGTIAILVCIVLGIVLYIVKSILPDEKLTGICQNCGYVFYPKTSSKKNNL